MSFLLRSKNLVKQWNGNYFCRSTFPLPFSSNHEKRFRKTIYASYFGRFNPSKALGFFYKDLFDLFQNSTLQSRLPMNLTVIKGECSETSGGKYLIEVYFAIVEPDTLY